MPLSMYELSVPTFLRGLEIADEYCDKAAEFAATQGIDPSTLLNARLAPDMLPFSGQIQRISDASKGPVGHLAAIPTPSFEDREQTFPALKTRIAKTSSFLHGIKPAQLLGSELRTIDAPFTWGKKASTGGEYLMSIALPNFYFHVAVAHDILRSNGVPLGNRDYLFLPRNIREAIG
jgi:hypothetical protein